METHSPVRPVRAALGPGVIVALALVLACFGVLATALYALGDTDVLRRGYSLGLDDISFVKPQGWLRVYYRADLVAEPIATILLATGAALLVARRRWGRIALTAGCAVVIALGLFGAAVAEPDWLGDRSTAPVSLALDLAPLAFPTTLIVLTWLPAVGLWCRIVRETDGKADPRERFG